MEINGDNDSGVRRDSRKRLGKKMSREGGSSSLVKFQPETETSPTNNSNRLEPNIDYRVRGIHCVSFQPSVLPC